MVPVAREFTTGNTPVVGMATVAGGPTSDAAAAAKAAWPRTLIRPPEQQKITARSFRAPGILTMLFVAALVWFLFFPQLGDLETTVPQSTALMLMRQTEAEAAVRRGSAPGAEGSCEGVRNDLPNCRKQTPVSLDSIAPAMVDAVRFATDSLFNARQGADWIAMRRAAGYPRDAFEWGNSVDRSDFFSVMPTLLNHMDVVGQSGSLTQRVVQTIWYPADNGLFRKAREIRLANRLAGTLTKDRILELYLNVAEFGPGLYGVEAASQSYFGIPASKLSKAQAATLAATLATPRTSTPAQEPEAMTRRQRLILRRLNGEAVSIPVAYVATDSAPRAP